MIERFTTKQNFSKNFKRWFRIAAIVVIILFAVLLIYTAWENRVSLKLLLSRANYSELLGFVAFYVICFSIGTINWVAIMLSFDDSLRGWDHIQIYCMTLATRRLPGTLWYIVGRVSLYQKLGLTATVVILANAIELIISLVTASIIGVIFLLLSRFTPSPLAITVLIISLVLASISLRPSVFRWLLDKLGAPAPVNLSFRSILTWVFLYSAIWITGGLMLNQLVNIFQPGSLNQTLYIIGAWALSITAGIFTFFLPTNFGLTELALAALLTPILTLPLAGIVAILMRFLTMILEIGVSIAFYFIALKSPRLTAIVNPRRRYSLPVDKTNSKPTNE